MKYQINAFCLCALGLFSAASLAEVPYASRYFSLNTGTGYAHSLNYNGKNESGFGNWGANIFLGTYATKYFGPEVGVGYFGLKSMGRVGLLGLSGRFTGRIHEKFLYFGKVGVGVGELRTCYLSCTTTSTFVPLFGAGMGWGITPEWMLTTEFNSALFPKNTGNGTGIIGGLTFGATRFF